MDITIRLKDDYFDLGTYSSRITTSNPEAQLWFDRGLIWSYGFNRTEAISCFLKAIAADSECAMAYWGVAYGSGAYYNKPWKLYDQEDLKTSLRQAYDHTQKAKQYVSNGSGKEKALIKAIEARYAKDIDLSERDTAYAHSMKDAYTQFGQDLDVAALYAESLMNLTPWAMWDIHSGQPAKGARTLEAKEVLETALKAKEAYEHPGLLHLYIHLMEMSREPELALTAADYLRRLIPEGGHLSHMPSHIDVLIGDYRGAIAANSIAISADNKYLKKVGHKNIYSLYRAHNFQSLIYAAMLCGKSQVALENAILLEQALPEDLLCIQSPPMADWLEAFLAVRSHVLLRFGMWDEILQLRLPAESDLYCVTTATMHYAKGVAWAAKRNVGEARKEQQLFSQAFRRVPETRYDYPNKCVDILKVAEAMLAGEVEYRSGNVDQAFDHLRKAVDLDDHLVYSEPWPWMQPTRHAYGALLLEQGHVEEAAEAYAADLGLNDRLPRGHQHPNNVWALQGYYECLLQLNRHAEADMLGLQLRLARYIADVPVTSSCLCKIGSEPQDHDSCQTERSVL